jgi:hypothetical protein
MDNNASPRRESKLVVGWTFGRRLRFVEQPRHKLLGRELAAAEGEVDKKYPRSTKSVPGC